MDTDKRDGFPTAQLLLLGLCRIAEPVALTSPLPYAYDFMKHLMGNDTSNAAFYAGIFVAMFSLTESFTGFWWGTLSDRIGRKPVLLLGCAGTLLSLFVLGFSMNIWMALLGRALGGALNGNVGVVQTMVGELVTRPEHEARAYAVMPFFFSIGCTIGPAVGGYFAKPSETWPVFDVALFRRFPFLLPNLVCTAMIMATIVMAYFVLDETHPEFRHRAGDMDRREQHENSEEAPLLPGSSTQADTSSLRSLNVNVKMFVVAVCLLSAHTVTYIQLLPIFLRTPRDKSVPPHYIGGIGGLDMSLPDVGLLMGVNGIIGLIVQLAFPFFTDFFGIKPTLLFVSTLHPLAYFCLPYLAFLSPGTWRTVGLYTWLTARTILSTFTYPILLILIKRWTPSTLILGRVNGLVASAGAACRTVSPAAAGLLQTIGENNHFSALAWWGSGVIATIAAVQCWFLKLDNPPAADDVDREAQSPAEP